MDMSEQLAEARREIANLKAHCAQMDELMVLYSDSKEIADNVRKIADGLEHSARYWLLEACQNLVGIHLVYKQITKFKGGAQ